MKDLSRKVSLTCRVCGNDMFETLDNYDDDLVSAPDNIRLRCSDCKHIYTKKELLDDNEEVINANLDEIKDEAIMEIRKELKESLKSFKNIKIKL